MAVLDDVSHQVRQEQSQLERRLRDAALTDALTQMPNRAALSALIADALLRRACEAGPQFAVLFLNCDRFKRVNDLFGTAVGDGLLIGDGAEGVAAAVMRDASIAMVEAKRRGGGRFGAFEPAMCERALQRGRTEAECGWRWPKGSCSCHRSTSACSTAFWCRRR